MFYGIHKEKEDRWVNGKRWAACKWVLFNLVLPQMAWTVDIALEEFYSPAKSNLEPFLFSLNRSCIS